MPCGRSFLIHNKLCVCVYVCVCASNRTLCLCLGVCVCVCVCVCVWFVQSAATLEPTLKARNDLYRKCHSGSRADLVAYREARGEARAAVRSAKESWLSKQADIVEAERFNTKSAWAAIRAIQR